MPSIVMVGLGPTIHEFATARTHVSYWTYILCNKPHGTLYVGMRSDLPGRIYQHREGLADGFTKRYGIKRLVYFEQHETALAAITREKTRKRRPRDWKIALIEKSNPRWDDLYDVIARQA